MCMITLPYYNCGGRISYLLALEITTLLDSMASNTARLVEKHKVWKCKIFSESWFMAVRLRVVTLST